MGRGLLVIVLLVLLAAPALADQRLAILAANMQSVLGDGDHAMECGPVEQHDSVVTNPVAEVYGQEYCVMRRDSEVIFGTYIERPTGAFDVEKAIVPMLEAYAGKEYSPHMDQDQPDLEEVCANYDPSNKKFQACDDRLSAIGQDIYLYVYFDTEETIYLIVSDAELSEIDPGLLEIIADFFKKLFGFGPEPHSFVDEPDIQEFHHAYFAKGEDRSVAAFWFRDTRDKATFIYKNFITDFHAIMPKDRGATFKLGTDHQQVIEGMRLSPSSAEDVLLWRRYTAGLRIKDVPGTPATGACGVSDTGGPNAGEIAVNFGEDCEASIPLSKTCKSLGHPGGVLKCDSCLFDVSGCGCIDDDADGYKSSVNKDGCGTVFDCDDANASIYPGAVDMCGTGRNENCSASDWAPGKDGAACIPPPDPEDPFPCDEDDLCDADEDTRCVDCSQMASSCPTAWTLAKTQGNYRFYTRKGTSDAGEMLVTVQKTKYCFFGTGSVEPLFLTTASPRTLFLKNSGARNMEVYVSYQDGAWLIDGDASRSGSPDASACLACADAKCASLDLRIPVPAVSCDAAAACAPKGNRTFTPEDCCNCLVSQDAVCVDDPLGCYPRGSDGGGPGDGDHILEP